MERRDYPVPTHNVPRNVWALVSKHVMFNKSPDNLEDKPAAVCKDGSTEYGLIAYGKGHGLDWAAIYGESEFTEEIEGKPEIQSPEKIQD